MKINCEKNQTGTEKDICNHFVISTYPTMKTFYKGQEIKYTPIGRDVESLLEYIDKIDTPAITEIKNNKEMLNFSKNNGDVSFLLVEPVSRSGSKKRSAYYKCYEQLAEMYKPLFYFGFMREDSFRNEYNIRIPAVLVYLIYNK